MNLQEKLQQILSQANSATEGPWFSHPCGAGKSVDCWCKVVGTTPDPTQKEMDCIVAAGSAIASNAEFIASSRVLVPALARALGVAVKALGEVEKPFQGIPNEATCTDWKSEAIASKIYSREALAEIEKLLEVGK